MWKKLGVAKKEVSPEKMLPVVNEMLELNVRYATKYGTDFKQWPITEAFAFMYEFEQISKKFK